MKYILANSDTVAFAISRALNCTDQTPEGAYTNDTDSIVVGHFAPGLIAPLPLQGYTDGSDFVKTLPFIPEDYLYGICKMVVDGKVTVSPDDEKAVADIAAIIGRADEVVFASDGGQDAQAGFYLLCQKVGSGIKKSRMWLTSLEYKAIRNAFNHRVCARGNYRMAQAGNVGMGMNFLFNTNIEQALAESYGKGVFNLNRQDIPALWLIDNYERMRSKFKPQPASHTVSLHAKSGDTVFALFPVDVLDDAAEADALFSGFKGLVRSTVKAQVMDVEDKVEPQAVLFDRASLQIAAAVQLGFLPGKTNAIANALFEKGLISSPNTRQTGLPERMRRMMTRRYPSAKSFPFLPSDVATFGHGIITTERTPIFLSNSEEALYNLIKENMEKSFAAPRRYREVVVCTEVLGMTLLGSAEVSIDTEVDVDEITLTICSAGTQTYSAKQPKPLTVAQAMSNLYSLTWESGKLIPPSAAHDMGLAIQRLLDNGFLTLVIDELYVTDKGRLLLHHVGDSNLADIGTLISQQAEVDALALNRKSASEVMRNYEQWLYGQIQPLVANPWLFANKPLEHKCPRCGADHLTVYPRTVICDKCGFDIPRYYKGYELTGKDIRQLVTHGYTSPIYGFSGRKGRKFCNALVLNAHHGLTFAPAEAAIY